MHGHYYTLIIHFSDLCSASLCSFNFMLVSTLISLLSLKQCRLLRRFTDSADNFNSKTNFISRQVTLLPLLCRLCYIYLLILL